MSITKEKVAEIKQKANDIRISLIEALIEAKSGHSGGSLGMSDVFATLYFHALKHDPKKPDWEERDRLLLSNGHICPVLYSTMAHAGYFPLEDMKTLRKFGSPLQGHPHREFLPALESSSGPLGSGLSQAAGMAIVLKREKRDSFVYCLTSDGEHNAGNTWEAVMIAGKEKLGNLIQIIDRNYIQIDGSTEDIMPLDPFSDKYRAFNWHVVEVDGHNIEDIARGIEEAKMIKNQPTIIIAQTILGKGVSFMENRYEWHGAPPGKGPDDIVPKDKQGEVALKELREKVL